MQKLRAALFSVLMIFTFSYPQDNNLKREFRGAWIATVANIDWPSRYATPGEQIADLVEQFDKHKEAGMNAIIFQVRTECDALYESSFEPWSYWLTGEQGKAPDPYFDPLAFAVSEAHARGMELHAWFNPYRAVKNVGDYEIDEKHVSVQHPEWILTFGKYKMLDPGIPAVRDFIASVIAEVVRKYDVDGIHFDDYFYPYSPHVSNEDSLTFAHYNNGYTDIDDWRRYNINSMVAQVYDSIKAIKPYVKFGISPFGIVQNHYAGTNGFSSYDILYCDPLTWIKDKTVDYITPQLYWEIGKDVADYKALLPWWASVTEDRHLYIGQYSSRFFGRSWKDKSEIGNQIRMNRATENVHGSIFFSGKSVSNNVGGFADTLKSSIYKYPALVPLMSWKENVPPPAPVNLTGEKDSSGITLKWELEDDDDEVKQFVIYKFNSDEEVNINNPAKILDIIRTRRNSFRDRSVKIDDDAFTYVVTSLDRLQNESEPTAVVTVE